MPHLLRTKIVCTIGPTSREPEMLTRLMAAGMDVARLNFSHGDSAFHGENIHRIREISAQMGKPVAILADLQGPKLRVGQMQEGGVPLEAGETLVLTTEPIIGARGRVPVQYEHLPEAVTPDERILIDDGLLELVVLAVEGREITTRVITGGLLNSNKGLNLPNAALSIPAITDKDRQDLRFALDQGVDWAALSFVRTADEVLELKDFIRELSAFGRPTPLIAKIEKPEAIANIDAIIAASDGIMVARGDLGIEMSPEAVPMLQKTIIRKCNAAGKPVITATQMLDSMIRNPRPTRAEASDVANAILDGSDAIMLSGETASGKYPLESVETMVRIAQEAEQTQAGGTCGQITARPGRTFAEAVAHASVETAIDLSAAAIIAPTVSGHTARTISRFRPPCPIVAVTPSPMAQRELVLFWGVYPVLSQRAANTDAVIIEAVEAAKAAGYVGEGDILVITAGSVEAGVGTTDLMKVHLIERVLAHGTGLGERKVIGRVRRLAPPLADNVRVEPDEIVVTPVTDRTFIPILRRAAGLVTEADAPDAHCRLLALEMGLPAVVGVREGIGGLSDGMHVVMDAKRGLVYERPAVLLRLSGE
ncbi:MAG: pyruvate kinase [Chloroflexi bacterium]|nr:pyruvate kinase [Chloroflexota bacterium]